MLRVLFQQRVVLIGEGANLFGKLYDQPPKNHGSQNAS